MWNITYIYAKKGWKSIRVNNVLHMFIIIIIIVIIIIIIIIMVFMLCPIF